MRQRLSNESLTFSFEPLEALLDEGLADLVVPHWEAIALDRDTVPLDIDWNAYIAAENAGRWKAFIARRDGKIVGYVAFFYYYPPRYQSTLYISDDTIWVIPEERNRGLIWYRLMKAAMAQLPRPCKLMVKAREPRVEAILQRLGLTKAEVLYSAVLQ